MLRSITSRSATAGRLGLASSRSTQYSSALPSSSAIHRSFTNFSGSRSPIASTSALPSSKLTFSQQSLRLHARNYATPAEDGDKKNSAKEHEDDDKKKKDFEESVERGLKEARQGKASGSLPRTSSSSLRATTRSLQPARATRSPNRLARRRMMLPKRRRRRRQRSPAPTVRQVVDPMVSSPKFASMPTPSLPLSSPPTFSTASRRPTSPAARLPGKSSAPPSLTRGL